MLPANPIVTLFDALTVNEINCSHYQCAQLLFNTGSIQQIPARFRRKLDQHIDIAVGANIVTQHRTKKPKALDLPFTAKLRYLLGGKIEGGCLHCHTVFVRDHVMIPAL